MILATVGNMMQDNKILTVIVSIAIIVAIVSIVIMFYPEPDSDGDGFLDINDDFPNNPEEWVDSDGDGLGDNSDVFPKDSTEWNDTDGDGFGDNIDLFPVDPWAWNETGNGSEGDLLLSLEINRTVVEVNGTIALNYTLKNNGTTMARIINFGKPSCISSITLNRSEEEIINEYDHDFYHNHSEKDYQKNDFFEFYPSSTVYYNHTWQLGGLSPGNYTIIGNFIVYNLDVLNAEWPFWTGIVWSNSFQIEII
jgi:hypothetical protein